MHHLLVVLTFQNEPLGREAQLQLCLGILTKFHEIPWEEHLRNHLEDRLYSRAANLAPVDSSTSVPCHHETETSHDADQSSSEDFLDFRNPPSKYDVIEIARSRFYEDLDFQVYDVLEPDDPEIEDLPILWTEIVDGPVLPPKDCWYVLCNPEARISNRFPQVGGEVRCFCISKTSGEVVYEDEYAEE